MEDRRYVDLLSAALLAEDRGYELVLVPEAWGRDAMVVLGAIAACTSRIRIGTGIVNVYSRSPALIAMAAATLDEISGGRAVLGLGVSGRAVVEGWHGATMAAPLTRLREVTEVVRTIVRRERGGYHGATVRVAPGFRLGFTPPRERIPVWHASLAPAALRQCGALADGWLPTLATPESLAADLAFVENGLRSAGRDRSEFTIAPMILALIGDRADAAALVKRHVAYYVGGMGRFYAEALARHGFGEAVRRIREEWDAGRREAAADAVPGELVDAVAVCGPPATCHARLAAWQAAGADLLVIGLPIGASAEQTTRTIRALGPG
ncbi:MAG TPA: LLM class flavin-dependent oxidoreductase [Candidatus Limnocylindria bacterium]|nr:LLM class flavin-dependent oxidoreductase [Candidatus Limnocylindria bacterium]